MTKRLGKPRTGIIAALDVGTSKVCCVIARAERSAGEDGALVPRVVGTGLQVSGGMKSGAIVDVDAAEAAIRKAVYAAEQMAGETVRSVTASLSAGKPASKLLGIDVDIGGHQIDDADLRRVFSRVMTANGHDNVNGAANGGEKTAIRANGKNSERDLIHSIPVAYAVDGDKGVRDPRGLFGDRLSVNMHLVTAGSGAVRTLRNVVERSHLEIDEFVVAPYAAGLSALVEDEMDLGVTVLDMGAGTTSIGVFFDGELIYADVIPVGGNHVTNDIARGLSTPLSHAERLKTLHGSAHAAAADEHELIDVPQIGEDDHAAPNHVPRSLLNGIIQPRIEETFELVRAHLSDSGYAALAGRRVVLTGGASQLQGIREMAGLILDKQIRMGRPLRLRGLPEAMAGPAFATSAGLIAYALENPSAITLPEPVLKGEPGGLGGRFGQWIREHF